MSDKESLVGMLAGLSILSLLFKFLSPRGFILMMAGIIYAILYNTFAPSPPAPKPVDNWETRLMAAGRKGDYQKALAIDEAYLKTHPNSCTALYWRLELDLIMRKNHPPHPKCTES